MAPVHADSPVASSEQLAHQQRLHPLATHTVEKRLVRARGPYSTSTCRCYARP
jgi:hypothetical protein